MNIDDFDDFNKSVTNSVIELDNQKQDIHLRIQKGKGRHSWTIVENIDVINTTGESDFIKKICKYFRKTCNCSVCIKENNVLQLQGDHRSEISDFLVNGKFAKKENVKIHGF